MPVAVTAAQTPETPARSRWASSNWVSSRWGRRALVAAVLCAVIVGGAFWLCRRERVAAKRLLDRGNWVQARTKLRRLLWLQPADSELRLMMAEAFARDDSHSAENQALEAVEHLRCIPDNAPQGLHARIREARLTLLVLHRPMAAQALLNRALAVDPNAAQAHTLLWTILSLTGREDLAQPVFQRLYELGPASSRREYLTAWFYSQMDLGQITAGLDEQMGFRRFADENARRVELNRLLAYRHAEPDEPVVHAAVARWFLDEGDPEQALHVLEQGLQIAAAPDDAYFVAALVAVLIELGRLEQADELFARWPEPHEGHYYWNSAGLLQAELHWDNRAAAKAYDQALAAWPGQIDWKCQFRKANCLALAGDEQHAAEARRRSHAIRDQFKPDVLLRLRRALEDPDDPENLKSIVDFYAAFGCDTEVRYWKETLAGGG
ncbi:MAG: tetratricopeptide repeat protein [Planctomycetaceae bacterium]|nr:tetratricopeptide repeat protein [Planctomycetaceae bacterium]